MTLAREIEKRLEAAIHAGREAAALTLDYYRRDDLAVDWKQDATPVTVADREAELLLRDRIVAAFPHDGVLGEEFPEHSGSSGFRWILDPIDGTKSFVHGVPLYGTLIGVEFERRSVVGVVLMPALDEYVYAGEGLGAWQVRAGGAPKPARVSQVDRLEQALFCVTTVSGFYDHRRGSAFDALRTRCRLTRGWGDCYGYMLVATGRADVMIDPKMSVWDCAALQPILREAGGTFTDWNGEPTIYAGEGIGTNGRLLEQVLAITRTTG